MSLAKLALMKLRNRSNELGPEEISAFFSAMGVEISLEPIEAHTAEGPAAVREFCQLAGGKSSKLARIRGKSKEGDIVEALLVIRPAPNTKVLEVPKKVLADRL